MPKSEPTPQQAFERLQELCSAAEYSTGEALDRLARKGITGQLAFEIVQRLVDLRFIDDERFARAYVRAKVAAGWGINKIRKNLLLVKKVDREFTDVAIEEEVDYERYCRNLAAALRSKARLLPNQLDAAARDKLLRFAVGRGYEIDLVLNMIADEEYWRSDENF